MSKIKVITLGCKVNSYESEALLEQFKSHGYEVANKDECADVVVINTCSVTSVADGKSRQHIRSAIKDNPNAIVASMGCYSQVGSEALSKIEGLNIIVGTNQRTKIYDYVNEYKETGKQIIDTKDSNTYRTFENQNLSYFADNVRAYLKIEDGCNNFCSYCIVPYTRGRVRSRDKDDVLNEARRLASNGFKEIVLSGIHTALYGTDFENYNFDDLLEDLLKIDGIERIRISSIEASEITDRFIEMFKNNPKIVNHIHIPLQSGCDSVLKRMNRRYDTATWANVIYKLRECVKDVAITSDVITGFPGETEEEYMDTYNFIKDMNLTQLHVFPYSRREGTVAARMPNQIDPKVKRERVSKLIDLSDELFKNYNSNYIGSDVKVLVEQVKGEYLVGHTTNYLKVVFKGDESLVNTMVMVHIDSQAGLLLEGTMIK